MTPTTFLRALPCVLTLLASHMVFAQELPETITRNGITFISGGIGKEESDLMIAEGKKWPLMIELTQSHPVRDLWIADATIKITNQKKVVLEAVSDGPIMLVRLNPGNYEIEAQFEGVNLKRNFKIEEGKSFKLPLTWPQK